MIGYAYTVEPAEKRFAILNGMNARKTRTISIIIIILRAFDLYMKERIIGYY